MCHIAGPTISQRLAAKKVNENIHNLCYIYVNWTEIEHHEYQQCYSTIMFQLHYHFTTN